MTSSFQYPIDLHWSEEDGRWIAEVHDLPGCKADGKTADEAISQAIIAAQLWLEERKAARCKKRKSLSRKAR